MLPILICLDNVSLILQVKSGELWFHILI